MDDEDTAQDRVAGSSPEKSFAEPREEAQRRDQRGSAGRTTSQAVAQAQLVIHDTSSIVLFTGQQGLVHLSSNQSSGPLAPALSRAGGRSPPIWPWHSMLRSLHLDREVTS